jgi:hypothetical protein
MKIFSQNFLTASGLALILGLSACNSDSNNTPNATPTISGEAAMKDSNKRGAETIRMDKFAVVQRFAQLDKKIDLAKLQTVVVSQQERDAAQSEDVRQVVGIFNTLLAAQNESSKLNLKLTMSDTPVEDGVFVFAIESDSKQDIQFEMFDEEGFELAAQNMLTLDKGANYKALNVRGLNGGSYLFRLQNTDGQSMSQKVIIQN